MGAASRSLFQLHHFLSDLILRQTTEIATTPRIPTANEDTIRPVIKALAAEGAVVGKTEKIGSCVIE